MASTWAPRRPCISSSTTSRMLIAMESSCMWLLQLSQELSNHMIDRRLHFLNSRNVIGVHHDGKIRQAPAHDLAAVVTQQGRRQQVPLARFFESHDDVF